MNNNFIRVFSLSCLALLSCVEERKPDLSFVDVIYCTPDNPAKCLPLEITNTSEGLRARYIGASSDQELTLRPRYEVDEAGDSTIVLDEYLDGKSNGKYIFVEDPTDIYYRVYQDVQYVSADTKDTITFGANIIGKEDIFIEYRDFPRSVRKIQEHGINDPVGCGSARRDLNILLLLHSNPLSFTESYEGIEDMSAFMSEDGIFRVYFVDCYSGGNGMSASYRMIPAQYKIDSGIITLSDISGLLYNRLVEFHGANFPKESDINVIQATLNGKAYYMIEVAYFDPQPAPFIYGNEDYYKTNALVLFAFSIENKKLTPAKILGGKSIIELVNMDGDENIHFKFDDKTKELQVPIVNPKDHTFTGKYNTIKLK